MKHYRKIGKDGHFIEDVIVEPTIDEDGNEIYEIPKDCIEEPFPGDSGFYKPKWDRKNKKWVEGDNEVPNYVKQGRYSRLQNIFAKKALGLKKIAIDKPYMVEREAIEQQYATYEAMYQSAKAGHFDDATNKEIIQANEAAKAALAQVVLLLNSVRSEIEKKIEAGDAVSDKMLDYAETIKLKKDEISPKKIAEIASNMANVTIEESGSGDDFTFEMSGTGKKPAIDGEGV